MQSLFEGSDESPDEIGLGIIPGRVTRFDSSLGIKVPQIGWNGVSPVGKSFALDNTAPGDAVSSTYFADHEHAAVCFLHFRLLRMLADFSCFIYMLYSFTRAWIVVF
jgi:imidazoleglycerol phosphate synthase glutamine amidotransferase subunit HisH